MPNQPISAQSVATNDEKTVAEWSDAKAQFDKSDKYWLTTINPKGKPHVRPIFCVWLEDSIYFTSSPDAQKGKNIEVNSHCSICAAGKTLDVIIEGEVQRVTDQAALEKVRQLYKDKYDWPITVEGDAYTAPYAAPSAGKPPYALYQITLTKAFGFGNDEIYGATRWQFA